MEAPNQPDARPQQEAAQEDRPHGVFPTRAVPALRGTRGPRVAGAFVAFLGTLSLALPGFAQFAASDPDYPLLSKLERLTAVDAKEQTLTETKTLAESDPDIVDPTYEKVDGKKLAATAFVPLELVSIWTENEAEQTWNSSMCGSMKPCELPQEYDLRPPRIHTWWRPSADTDIDEIRRYFEGEEGREVKLSLNGRPLVRADGWGAYGDYMLWVVEGQPCHPLDGDPCVKITFHREQWYETERPPWGDWEVRMEFFKMLKKEEHALEFDRFGNPVVVREVPKLSGATIATITSKPELKNYWEATLGRTISSERCISCHTLETWDDILDRHGFGIQESYLVPSIIDETLSVNHCKNCHEGTIYPLYESSGYAEHKWATPTAEMDINWGQIIEDYPDSWPAEICNRIVDHLPTHAARAEHFHEDARLFWAVQNGKVPEGRPDLPTAFPHDYGTFIAQFDAWNDEGAICPE